MHDLAASGCCRSHCEDADDQLKPHWHGDEMHALLVGTGENRKGGALPSVRPECAKIGDREADVCER